MVPAPFSLGESTRISAPGPRPWRPMYHRPERLATGRRRCGCGPGKPAPGRGTMSRGPASQCWQEANSMALTTAQVEEFQRNGFLAVQNVLTPDELAAMRQRAEEIARGELPEGSRITRQVEPAIGRGEAMAPTTEDSLRKMVKLALEDGVFRAHAMRPSIVECLQALLGPDITLYHDQLFMKAPRVGSRQPYHQDQPAGF